MSGFKITELYAWVCTDKDGDEGIIAFLHKGIMMPMIGSDMERIESLRSTAVGIAKSEDLPLKLIKFSEAEIIKF